MLVLTNSPCCKTCWMTTMGENFPDASTLLKSMHTAVTASRVYCAEISEKLSGAPPENQFQRHGFSWISAYSEVLAATLEWAEALADQNRFHRLEQLSAAALFNEYSSQMIHGISMSQDEIIRPSNLDTEEAANTFSNTSACTFFKPFGIATLANQIVEECLLRKATGMNIWGDRGLDETFEEITHQFRDFADKEIIPNAHEWHLKDQLIPDGTVKQLAELGVFGLTISEEHGGTGLGKLAMCVVTEELARGYIGVGSLGTRSEIAAELIINGGTDTQKNTYLPKIASGELLPVAVFTEPDTGSDLASLVTKAVKQGDEYVIKGNKTWITHAARSDLMTLLVRTDPSEKGHRGLTMLLVEKTRGDEANPFPDTGIDGGEIPVLGYRGMKEYEMSFDGLRVPVSSALGECEGEGFRQLMNTFESARIQTAARALGVAVNAMEIAFEYAESRKQFGKPIIEFERIYGKLARMVVEITGIRQLSFMAARKKDQGGRCDVEAGMAKLLAARLAWSAADNALQIHGGIGYALESPISRILADARILNIFEGAAEMQAEVIARGLLPRKQDTKKKALDD